GSLEA
ncbi:hypothetical protein O988_07065, partial [Pseudogymnoascus sp. VKM F-3808]